MRILELCPHSSKPTANPQQVVEQNYKFHKNRRLTTNPRDVIAYSLLYDLLSNKSTKSEVVEFGLKHSLPDFAVDRGPVPTTRVYPNLDHVKSTTSLPQPAAPPSEDRHGKKHDAINGDRAPSSNDCTLLHTGASIPMGQGGHVPPIFGLGGHYHECPPIFLE